nr:retrovirus-related Pol polyprotein from transposon TNT 1-94 [Tanacetum cinerariifolium]
MMDRQRYVEMKNRQHYVGIKNLQHYVVNRMWCRCGLSKFLRFVLDALRFVYFKDLAFCLGSTAICLLQISCVLSRKHCVLSTSKILRFVSEALRFVYFKDLAFCLGSTVFCILQRSCVLSRKHCDLFTSKILRFVSEAPRFVYFKGLAFCLGSTAICLLQRSCVLSQKHRVLSTSKVLHFVSEALRFVYFKDLAFCLGSTAFCPLQKRVAFCADCVLPNGDALRKCILSGPYKPTTVLVQEVDATDDSPAILEHTTLRKCGKLSKGYNKMNPLIFKMFVTIVKQQHKLDEVSYHKLFDILKQYQKEVNELRAKRLARNANPLALVSTAQANQNPYYQTSKSHKSYAPSSKPSIPTRTHTTTRYKGKEIAKPITPPSETTSEENIDPEQAQRYEDMQKNLALIAKYFKKIYKPTNNNLRTSSNSRNKNVDTTLRYKNDNQSGQFGNQRTVTVAGARENVGNPVVQQSGIKCFNCKEFGHFAKECRKAKRVKDFAYHKENMLLCKQAKKVETDDSNVIPDSPDMCDDDIQNDQNDVESDDERVALANLIANLKLDVDKNKKIQKQLKKANTTLAQELKECKTILAETSKTLGESNSVRDKLVDNAWIKHSKDQFRAPTTQDIEILIHACLMPLALKTHNDSFIFVHELKQEMYADLKYVESLKKEIDELESDKAEFSNMYDIILQECVSNDVMCSYLLLLSDLDALAELQCLYLYKVKECDYLAQNLSKQTESVSKEVHTKLLQCFAKVEKHLISLEIALQKCKEQNVAISELKKLIEKGMGKSVETKFDKPSVVRQPNVQWIPKPSVLGVNQKTNVSRPHHRSNQLKDKIVPNNSQIVQLILFIVDSGCTKHMTGNLKLLCNFVETFLDLQGNDLLTGNCGSDLYTVSLQASTSSTPLYLMAKASPTQAWLWHRRLSHCNFDYINLLSKKDVMIGLPKLKYVKDQLYSSCELSKAKRSSFKSKAVPSSKGRLNLLHMDLCGLMRVASINEKKYILVIVDDYSRYTWTLFLRSKDDTPEVLKEFLTMIQRNLQAPMITIRTDRGTEFLKMTLNAFFKEEGIEHQTSIT